MSENETIVELKEVIKSYYENEKKKTGQTEILHGINLSIKKGDFIAVMGPSGSGKSTLLYTTSGMEKADSGEIIIDGENLTAMDDNNLTRIRRDKFGFVFQNPCLLKNMSILDNIILLAMKKNGKDKAKIIEKAKALMQKTGIADLAERDITKVSGGQLQRAGICRALMNEPKILFADEPTGALNSKSSDEIMELFTTLNTEGNTILLVTHDARVAAKASKVLFMVDGQIVNELNFSTGTNGESLDTAENATTDGKPLGANLVLDGRVAEINKIMQTLGV